MSLWCTVYIAPKPSKARLKNAKLQVFFHKSAFLSKKVGYKVSLCENCRRQSCKAFPVLSNHAQMVGGEHPPLTYILLVKWTIRWCDSSAHQRFKEIWPIPYLHRNDYNTVWNS